MSSLSSPSLTLKLCWYVNMTCRIQVVRIANGSDGYFERIVFPGQRLIFEAPQNADLEIHSGAMSIETVPCKLLEVRSRQVQD